MAVRIKSARIKKKYMSGKRIERKKSDKNEGEKINPQSKSDPRVIFDHFDCNYRILIDFPSISWGLDVLIDQKTLLIISEIRLMKKAK